MSNEGIIILFGIFLYVFSFSFYTLKKKFINPKPVLLLSLAYATIGTMSLTFNPLALLEASVPLWAKVFSLSVILLGWFIVGLIFFAGAMIAYFKIRSWSSYKHIRYPIHHPTYSEPTYYPPVEPATLKYPMPREEPYSKSSDEIIRKLLESD